MEEPLRAIVFAAQVNSGYWRRNGYALLSQVCLYHLSLPLTMSVIHSEKSSLYTNVVIVKTGIVR